MAQILFNRSIVGDDATFNIIAQRVAPGKFELILNIVAPNSEQTVVFQNPSKKMCRRFAEMFVDLLEFGRGE